MTAQLAQERVVGGAHHRARTPLARNLAGRASVSLDELLSVAELTTRLDRKYLVPIETLPDVIANLPDQVATLDINGRRVFEYESVYFDTASFELYRQHAQGRRRRYKARTRSYGDSRVTMFEVKLKGPRGQTLKERLPYDYERRGELTTDGRAFLDQVTVEAYGVTAPPLQPALTTAYDRATLVDLECRSRMTIDVNLGWSDGTRTHETDDLALVETKSLAQPGPVDAVLGSMGLRPVRLSKYCLGVALLHPETAANPWSRTRRQQFGWQRDAEPDSVVVVARCDVVEIGTGSNDNTVGHSGRGGRDRR
jgi:hypothetical protein